MTNAVDLKTWLGEEKTAPAPAPAKSSTPQAVDMNEYLGVKPAGADLPSITKETGIPGGPTLLGEGQVDPKTGQTVHEGFFANLKNPLHLWMKESLPANVYEYLSNRDALNRKAIQSAAEEAQDKDILANPNKYPPAFIASAKERQVQRDARKFNFGKIVDSAKEDPGRFGAEFVNALIADPILAFTPMGLGGSLSRAAAVTGRNVAGATGATVGRVGGRVAEGALAGGVTQAPISGAKQLATDGKLDAPEMLKEAGMAAAVAGPLAGLLGKTTKPALIGPPGTVGKVVEKPRLRGPAAVAEELTVPEPTAAEAPTGFVAEQVSPTEGTAVGKPRLKGPPGQFGAVGDLRGGEGAQAPSRRAVADMDDAKALGLTVDQLRDLEQGKPPVVAPQQTIPDSIKLMTWMAAGSAGALGVQQYLKRKEEQEQFNRLLEEENKNPQPTDDGTYFANRPEWLVGPALLGAVKAKGGMWHPEALGMLGERLFESITNGRALGRPRDYITMLEDLRTSGEGVAPHTRVNEDLAIWSDKAVKNYLNKHAGTATDPLKDIEIPFGDGTKRWEELTDAVIHAQRFTPEQLRGEPPETGIRPNEDVWNIDTTFGPAERGGQPRKAIESYISHVGDYLRQNVSSEKLGQYDFVRAVKETAAHDARMAKEAEKAAVASAKDLPTYKQYDDGYRWVELKAPEKLTPEQARTVRPLTEAERKAFKNDSGNGGTDYDLSRGDWHVAVDPDGKPIKNSYTGELAIAPSAREAFLAGQLAQEGNVMGHCVGGYCADVFSGETKIYSLRDPKGKSHVTVEVEPARPGITESGGRQYLHARGENLTNNILQIKGKQNRAPNSEYLPYVQDFVRSGKWGDVQDLQNTGLLDIKDLGRGQFYKHYPAHGDAPLTYAEVVYLQQAFAGQRYVDRGAYQQALDSFAQELNAERNAAAVDSIQRGELPRGQDGKIDPDWLFKLAALGVAGYTGSYLNKDNPLLGAGAGLGAAVALGMSPKVWNALKNATGETVKGLDYGLGLISTRIRNISPALHHRAIELERNVLTRTHDAIVRVEPFLVELNKVKDKVLDRAILTNDEGAVLARIKELGNGALLRGWSEVRSTLRDLGEELQGLGRFKEAKEGYFPRIVTDRKGLLKALGGELKTRLELKLHDAEATAIKSRGTGLTQVEQSVIINRFLQENERAFGQPGFTKGRKVKEVTEALEPFYASPTESLHSYIRAAVKDLEMVKFFGKDIKERLKGDQRFTDVDSSIGKIVREELESGRITGEQAEELRGMLRARFISGERATTGVIQDAKNLANAGLLGNIVSAASQIGDTFTAVYAQDLRSTLRAVGEMLTGRKRVDMNDFGLADHISEEFVSTRASAKFLNSMFKFGGFNFIDRVGKNVNLNAALAKFERWAQTEKGAQRIRNEYGESFGQDIGELINDLRNRKITDKVESLLFHELSDVQPITKLESPQGKLELQGSPVKDAAASVYMLHSFMLKQLDIVRRDAYNEIAKGDPKSVARGFKNLTEYAVILGIGGATADMVKDWIRGRDSSFDGTSIAENILKTFGWAAYAREKFNSGHPGEAVVGIFTPPYKMMDDIWRRDPKAVRYIPLLGDWYYNRYLGGNEKAAQAKEKREARELNRALRVQ